MMNKKPRLGYLELHCSRRSGKVTIVLDYHKSVRPETIRPLSESALKPYEHEASQYWGAALRLLERFVKKDPGIEVLLGKVRTKHKIHGNTSYVQVERSFQGFPRQWDDWDLMELFIPVEWEWDIERGFSEGYLDLYVFPFDYRKTDPERIVSAKQRLCSITGSIEIALAQLIGIYLEDKVISLSLQDPTWQESLPPYGSSGFEFQGLILDRYEMVLDGPEVETHDNILFLTRRMDDALQRRDYAGVLHASASILETMAKDIVGIPSVQDQTLGSFFSRYCVDSHLPQEVLDYVFKVYGSRNKTPLAGHGSTESPNLGQEAAIALCELTKAIVRIEYKLRESAESKAA